MFNSLLAACAGKARWGYNVSAEHVRNAEALLADMRAAGHTPDDVTHLNMATLYARAGMCAAAAACGPVLAGRATPASEHPGNVRKHREIRTPHAGLRKRRRRWRRWQLRGRGWASARTAHSWRRASGAAAPSSQHGTFTKTCLLRGSSQIQPSGTRYWARTGATATSTARTRRGRCGRNARTLLCAAVPLERGVRRRCAGDGATRHRADRGNGERARRGVLRKPCVCGGRAAASAAVAQPARGVAGGYGAAPRSLLYFATGGEECTYLSERFVF